MAKKGVIKNKKKKSRNLFIPLLKIVWFVVKIPYFLVEGIYLLTKKTNEKIKARQSNKKRESMKSEYAGF